MANNNYESVAMSLSDGAERKFLICDETLSAVIVTLKESIVSSEITFSAVACNIENGEESIVIDMLEKMNEVAVGGFFSYEIVKDSIICVFTERFVTGDASTTSKKKCIEDLINIGILNLKNAIFSIKQRVDETKGTNK